MPAKPSPFPGMDPYLERHWSGIHARLMGYAADALAPQLGDDLAARLEEKVHIDQDDEARLNRWPDMMVVEQPSDGWAASRPATGAATLVEPVLLADPGPFTERWIQIVDLDGGRVVTAIEFLSPWNKLTAGGGRGAYLRKRREFRASDPNLVEVDLIRAGECP